MTPDATAPLISAIFGLFWLAVLLTVLLTPNSHGKKIKALRAEVAALRAEQADPPRATPDPAILDRLTAMEGWAQNVAGYLKSQQARQQ